MGTLGGEIPLEAEASTFKQQLARPWKLYKPKMLSWSVPWRDMGPGPFFNGRKEMRKWIKNPLKLIIFRVSRS